MKIKRVVLVILAVIIIGLLALSILERVDGLKWTRGADLPVPRSEVAAAALGREVYVIGGLASRFEALDNVDIYNTEEDSWREGARLPVPLHHTAAAGYAGKIYVIGGYTNGTDFPPVNSVYIYDPETDSWSKGAEMPTPRGALTVQVLGDYIYAVGGQNRGALAVNEAYNPRTDTWEKKAPMPTPREHLASGIALGKLYVIGGRGTSDLNVNEAYDPASDAWAAKAPMPSRRGGIAAATLNTGPGNRIYVFGGEGLASVFNSVEEYHAEEDIWRGREPMPTGRHGLGAVALGNSIYVIGGATAPRALTITSLSGANEILTIDIPQN